MKLQGNVNVYNLFNGSASSTLNTNYGPLWLQPSLLQDGRMLQFSASLDVLTLESGKVQSAKLISKFKVPRAAALSAYFAL